MMVVLPTPGPPVITASFRLSAVAVAACCPAARVTPSLPSALAIALSVSISGQDGAPAPRSRIATAMAASARCRGGRKMTDRPAMASSTTPPEAISSRKASARMAPSISSSLAASASRSSRGRPQSPLATASISA
jgi:hypothetical protein